MELGMSLEPRLEQKQELKLKQALKLELKLGYEAYFMYKKLEDHLEVVMLNSTEPDAYESKEYTLLGEFYNDLEGEGCLRQVLGIIWNHYIDKELYRTPLAYSIYDENMKEVDNGYIQDKFGKGLKSGDYSVVKKWKALQEHHKW